MVATSRSSSTRRRWAMADKRNGRSRTSRSTRPSSTSGEPSAGKRDFAVGYGRPPVHTRWAKGISGNKKRGPNRVKPLSAVLRDVVQKRIIVADESGQRRISKLEAALTQLANRAAQGDPRAIQQLLRIEQQIEPGTDAATELNLPAKELGDARGKLQRHLDAIRDRL